MPGLVPGIRVFDIFSKIRRGWPGIDERKRRRPSDGCARPWRRRMWPSYPKLVIEIAT